MNKKIGIAMAALMMAALVAPAVMAADYTVTVLSGQSTSVAVGEVAFGDLKPGASVTIPDSLTLTNVGNDAAIVNAKFTTSVGTPVVYGLVSGTNAIGGSNFYLGDTTLTALGDAGADTLLDGVAANTVVTYDAKLQVPAGQAPGVGYTGAVTLTIS